jgi:photosystem II stability/assembly factor-like uncharacterized protein
MGFIPYFFRDDTGISGRNRCKIGGIMRKVCFLLFSFAVAAIGVSVILAWQADASDTTISDHQLREVAEHHRTSPPRPFDEPDAAMEYARLKRRGPTEGFDTVAAYRRGKAQINRMPRYSTRLGAPLARRTGADLHSIAKSFFVRALGTWRPLGPGNIGGRTRTLVIHPDHPEIMYAGGVSGGVWKTTDGGGSWRPIADQIANIAVNSLAMHSEDPETLYVGTGEGHFREIVRGTWLPLRGAGVWKTSDGGANWTLLAATDTPDFYWVNDLVTSPHDADRIYAATRNGVFLSENAGTSWERILDPDVNGGCLDLALRTDQEVDWVYASCGTFEQATVYRLKMEGAREWRAVLSEPGMGRTSLAIAPSDQSVIYALSASNLPGPNENYEQALHAVYRSTTGGSEGSWRVRVDNTDPNKVNTLLLSNPIIASLVECGEEGPNGWSSMGWYCNVIAVDPADPEVVWAGGVDLFRSDDGGRTWGPTSYWWGRNFGPKFAHADQHAVVFHPDYDGTGNTTMFMGGDGGIFRTDNPRAGIGHDIAAICDPNQSSVLLTPLNNNLGITQFYHGAPFPGGNAYLGGTQDNGTILGNDVLGGDGWQRIRGADGGYVAVDPTNPDIVYAESQRFGFARSSDGGVTFEDATDGIIFDDPGIRLPELERDFLFITPYVMDPNQPQRLWAGGRRLWRTDDGASNWGPASTEPLGSGRVSALAVAPGNSQITLAGTTDGYIHRNDEALTADGTTVWESSRPREGFISSLAFEPGSTVVVYATFAGFGGKHVWRSTDGGMTWEAIDGGGSTAVPDIPVHSIVVDPNDPRRLYLGTDLGVITSINGGRTWAVENTGFSNAVTEWLAMGSEEHGNPALFAFTHGRGAWKVDLQGLQASTRSSSGRRAP